MREDDGVGQACKGLEIRCLSTLSAENREWVALGVEPVVLDGEKDKSCEFSDPHRRCR
jgi:hypothetical protein